MSETPNVSETPDEQPEEEEQAAEEHAGGPVAAAAGPFRIHGSDGSERGPFTDLERAQATADALRDSHKDRDVTFEVKDSTGAVQE